MIPALELSAVLLFVLVAGVAIGVFAGQIHCRVVRGGKVAQRGNDVRRAARTPAGSGR